jgi:small-conductance mechanosensitive channel
MLFKTKIYFKRGNALLITTQPTNYLLEKFSEGMRKLRTAALLHIISTILVVAALIAGYGFILASVSLAAPLSAGQGPSGHASIVLGSVLGTLITILVIGVLGFIIDLIATFGYLLPASAAFAEYDRSNYGTVSTLLKIGYLGGLISILV